jgi:GNAT superfamily N-acetyltransferase
MMTNSAFEATIRHIWAGYFRCELADFERPGTHLMPWEDQRDSNWLYLWHIGQRTFIRLGPQWADRIAQFSEAQFPAQHIQAADLVAQWQPEQAKLRYTVELCYLHPEAFKPAHPPTCFGCRQLSAADRPALTTMQGDCSAADLDEGDVDIDHEVAFGCWHEERLTAVASMYTIRGGFADVGILTHPDFRGRGLGKAAVSSVCSWLIAQGKLPMYRYEVNNLGSAGVARSLGFRPYYRQESVELVDVSE